MFTGTSTDVPLAWPTGSGTQSGHKVDGSRSASTPDAPTDFVAGVGDMQVTLAWVAPGMDSGVTRHEFQYKTDGDYLDVWTAIANSAPGEANENAFTVTGLTNEVPHTFELRAVNTLGEGAAAESSVTPTPGICDRTQEVHEAIVGALSEVDDCAAVTVADLAGLGSLEMSGGSIASLKSGDFAGLTGLTFLTLGRNSLITLPEDVFSGLTALRTLDLGFNDLSSLDAGVFSDLEALVILELSENELSLLPETVFSGLTELRTLNLEANILSSLDAGLFSNLTALVNLNLANNKLASLPDELFLDLTSLGTLSLGGNTTNPMQLTVTVEKVGTDQVRARVLAGAPFAVDIPVTVVDGTLAGGATTLSVALGSVYSEAVDVTRTAGTTTAVTVDVDLSTQPTLPGDHSGYEFAKATTDLPATILPDSAAPIDGTPSADALVSNVGQDQSTTLDGGSVAHERQVAQAFRTGTNEDGYTFAGVDIVSASSTGFTAQLCSTDASGHPTSSCTGLTPPDSFAVGAMSFTPPADGTRPLTKDTIYAVVLTTPEHDTPGHGTYYSQGWSATDSTGEDTVSAAGWSIADGHLLRPSRGALSGLWGTRAGGVPLRIAIRGTAVGGTPSTPTLSLLPDSLGDEDKGVNFIAQLTDADGEFVEADVDVTATWTASIESGDTAVAADLGSTTTGTLTIEGGTGATSTLFRVMIEDDALDEDDETFTVTLSGVSSNAQLATDPTAKGTIVDNDDPPTLSVADVSVSEASGSATFAVTLSPASGKTVTVNFAASAESSDTAESPADFNAFDLQMSFSPGAVLNTTAVQIVNDSILEPDETFTVTLSNATNAEIPDATATGTITNDDVTPSVEALVSNVGQPEASNILYNRRAQVFTTGSNASGYILTGVDVVSASSTGFTAQVCETDDISADPTLTCWSLDPGSFAIGTVSFTPPADTRLQSGKNYAVVVGLLAGASRQGIGTTSSDDEDAGAAPGWSIADAYLNSSGSTWSTASDALRIAIKGNAATGTPSTPTLSVDDEMGSEDDEVVNFWAQLKDADGEVVEADADVTVTWTASFESGDTAVAADLGTTTTGTVTIEGGTGATSTMFSVMLEDDSLDEDDETFTVTLSGVSASAQLAADPTAKGTIVDDDDPPTVSVGNATATEGDPAEFTVTLSAVSGRDVTVDWATSVETGDTATSDTDFTAASGTLTIPAGNETGTVMVVTVEDTTVEDDETFTVTLSNATNAAISDATATGTITNDDAADTTCTLNTGDLWCGDVTVGTSSDGVGFVAAETETDTDVGALTDNNGDQTITIGSDGYTIPSLLVLSGARAGTLAITLDKSFPTDDVNTLEFYTDIGTKTFKVSEATAYPTGHGYFWADSDLTWSDGGPDATLRLRRALPEVTIAADRNSYAEVQGNAGFTLSRTGSTAATLTVTVEVTQQVDRDLLPDGAAAVRTVTFAVGGATAALTVALENDDLAELPGNLTVRVQAGMGYTVGAPGSATVSVADFDTGRPQPANLTASAGAGVGEVALSWDAHAPQLKFSRHQYRYKTDGNYAAWTDIPNSGQNDSLGGDGSNLTGYTVTGLVGGQLHTFQVRTYSSSSSVSDPSDEATVTPRSAAVSFGAESYSVDEGGTVEVTVQLDAAPGREVVVPVSAAGAGGATGADWSGVPGNVTFGATDTAQTFTLAATDDTDVETGESVSLSFGTLPAGVTAGTTSEASVTIVDNDASPTLSVADAEATEGNDVTFTVTLAPAAAENVTVNWATTDDSATSPADFTAASDTLTFMPGETTATVAVATIEDTLDEPDEETFTLTLSSPSNATLGEATATGTITDNDDPPTLGVADAAATEGSPATFTVTLSAAATDDVTATWTASTIEGDEEKAAAADLESTTGSVTVPKGETAATFTVATAEDALDENDETFTVALSSPSSNATLAADATTATGTITDDDARPALIIADMSAPEESNVEFTVTLTPESGRTVTVGWGTFLNSGQTAEEEDFTSFPQNGFVTFPPGQTTAQLQVGVVDDALVESDETFEVTLGSASNARLEDNSAIGTIVDNDVAPNAAPTFTSAAMFNPAENQTAVGTVRVEDSDGDAITDYALSGGADQALFSIGSTSGVLTFQAAPNYEDPQDANTDNAYVVVVQATSGKDARVMTADQTITVTVMDDDTEAPGAPDAPSVSPASVTSLNVNWSAPDNAGPEITDYDVQYRAGTSAPWSDGASHIGGPPSQAILTAAFSINNSGVLTEDTRLPGAGAGDERRGHEAAGPLRAAASDGRERGAVGSPRRTCDLQPGGEPDGGGHGGGAGQRHD